MCPSLVTVDVSALVQKVVKAGVSGVGQMRKGTAIQNLTPKRDENNKTENEKENNRVGKKRKRERKAERTDGLVLIGKRL